MAFASLSFLAFLCVVLCLYYLVPRKWQWGFLLVASFCFYALSGVLSLAVLLVVTLLTFLFGKRLSRMQEREAAFLEANRASMTKEERKKSKAEWKKRRDRVLFAALVTVFGVLLADKLAERFLMPVCADLMPAPVMLLLQRINLPFVKPTLGNAFLSVMGISYFVFMAAGYLIDVNRGKVRAEKNFFRLSLFLTFFPQTVQGPIGRFSELEEQLFAPHRAAWEPISRGFLRMLWGFFKKLVIADAIAPVIGKLTGGVEYTGGFVLLAAVLYTAQIYGDFTGGIDITIGIAEMMGIRLSENFRHPFSSVSLKEYWNRWHITMGAWFTDYLFYPLSVSKPMQKLSKKSREKFGNPIGRRVPVYLATALTWFATGVWHGLRWNFIVWAMLNCAVLLISQECEPWYRRFHARFPGAKEHPVYRAFCRGRTFLLVGFLRLFDIYADVPTTFARIGSVFCVFNFGTVAGSLFSLGVSMPAFLAFLAAVAIVWTVSKAGEKHDVRSVLTARPAAYAAVCALLVFVILVFGAYGMGYDASQFIYGGAKFK